MPAYDFLCPCGRVTEQRHLMSAVPASIECECGGKAARQLSVGSLVDTRPCSSKYPYVSARLPLNARGCKTNGIGQPVIQNRQHEDRVLKTLGYERE